MIVELNPIILRESPGWIMGANSVTSEFGVFRQESRLGLNHAQTTYCNYQPNGLKKNILVNQKMSCSNFFFFKRLLWHHRGKTLLKIAF